MFKFLIRVSTIILTNALFSQVGLANSLISFGTVEPGSLEMTGGLLATGVTTETSAVVEVQALEGGTVQVLPPILISGPTPDPPGTTLVGLLSVNSTRLQSNGGGGSALLPQGNSVLEVGLQVTRPAVYSAQIQPYVYRVTILAMVNGETQTQNIDFSVTPTPACEFTNPRNGELQLLNQNLTRLETITDASVELHCNAATRLSLTPPTLIQGPNNLNSANLSASATLGGITINSNGNSTQVFTQNGGDGVASLEMQLNNNSIPIPPGTYQFNVMLTASPE